MSVLSVLSVLYSLLMVMPASCWLLHEPQRVIQQGKARCWDDSKRTERFQKSNGQQCGKSYSIQKWFTTMYFRGLHLLRSTCQLQEIGCVCPGPREEALFCDIVETA